MDLAKTGNLIEGYFWCAVGVCFVASMLRGGDRGRKLLLAAIFVAFGFTDFVEMRTGAWWRPWWLLVWKGACIAVMAWALWDYLRQKKATAGEDQAS